MQTALALSSTPFLMSSNSSSISISSPPRFLNGRFASIRSNAHSVNYNSTFSVFPAEACETIGGDTCAAHMNPEVKPEPRTTEPRIGSEAIEREYMDYEDPRTVLLGEACDVLGGEFCDNNYQEGIYKAD